MNGLLSEIHDGVLAGDASTVSAKILEAIQAKMSALEILDCMSRSMVEVGNLFEEGEYFVPEMLIAARAMQQGIRVLRPELIRADVKSAGLVVAGTVQGDLHEIGKNLVCMLLECAGFTVRDLGMDVSPEEFVRAVMENHPDIVAMSALLTTTMPNMRTTIEALCAAQLRERVKIMVGGAPITENYAHQVGADGYARDASQAVKLAKSFMAKR